MHKAEVKKLLQWATANFPGMQERDMRPTAALWEKILGDLSYDVAETALIKVLATAKFFPTVAEIREAAVAVNAPQGLTAAEAWGIVIKSIKDYGYYREAEALQSMPEAVAQVVRWMGWQELCHSDNVDVIRGQFLKMYEAETKRHQDFAVLPPAVRDFISDAAKTLKLIDAKEAPESEN